MMETWLQLLDINVDDVRSIDLEKRVTPTPIMKYLLLKRARQLRKKGYGYLKLAKILKDEFHLRRIPTSVYFWLTAKRHPLTNIKIPQPSYEVAYILCAGLGDGTTAYAKTRGVRKISFNNIRDADFVFTLKRKIEACCGGTANIRFNKRGYYDLDYDDSTFLGYLLTMIKRKPSIIYPLLKQYPTAIRGLFDADGGAYEDSKAVLLYNTNFEIIKLVSNVLKLLRIHHLTRPRSHADIMVDPRTRKIYQTKDKIFEIYIRRCCLLRYRTLIGFSIKRKLDALDRIIKYRREKMGDERHKIRWCPPS